MFSLFKKKRRKVANWELALLSTVIKQLPTQFEYLETQINQGLFLISKITTSKSGFDYVSFSFDPDLIDEFEKRNERNYQIKGVKLYDKLAEKKLDLTIYVYSGLIAGYLIEGAKNFDIDISQIDTKFFTQVYSSNQDFKKLRQFLSTSEAKLIKPDDVYEIILNDKIYFHIQDLSDGDFIGIDTDKVVYRITHDPFEIKPIDKSLKEVLD